ncbi:MAG: hypothetical protein AAF740_13040 [Bacteroidota bacterium]
MGIHAKNYLAHLQNLGTVNFFNADYKSEFLYILVLTAQKADWKTVTSNDIPKARYGNSLEDWEAYAQQKIKNLLEEFHQSSTINLQVYFVGKSTIATYPDLDDDIEPLTKNLVLVADPFALYLPENQNIAHLFDTKDKAKIRACLFPVCEQLSVNQQGFAYQQREKAFKRLSKCWGREFYKSYTHIELDIPNKIHFFRRLANIAYLRDIEEKETMAHLKLNNKQLFKAPESSKDL